MTENVDSEVTPYISPSTVKFSNLKGDFGLGRTDAYCHFFSWKRVSPIDGIILGSSGGEKCLLWSAIAGVAYRDCAIIMRVEMLSTVVCPPPDSSQALSQGPHDPHHGMHGYCSSPKVHHSRRTLVSELALDFPICLVGQRNDSNEKVEDIIKYL